MRTKEGDHGQAAVLQLGGLQVEGALVRAGGQAQGVEHAARVLAPLDVLLCVAVDLCASHQQHLDDGQLPAVAESTQSQRAPYLSLKIACMSGCSKECTCAMSGLRTFIAVLRFHLCASIY